MEGLPQSWRLVPLSEIVDINPGIDKSQLRDHDEVAFVPMPAVDAESGRIDVTERRQFGEVKSGFTPFATGDVLFAKITPCMENGKMAVVPSLPRGVGFGTTEFHVLRSTGAVNEKLVYYFVSSASIRHEAQHQMTGAVGQKRVPRRYLETKPFPLPPLNEQRRIVEKIETLFARIEKGEEALRDVQKLLARYRQSVLKAAVTGQLTDTGPATWKPATLGDLLEDIRYGTAKKCRPDVGGVAVLRIPNVANGEIDLQDLKYTKLDDREVRTLGLRKGDLLIVRSNGSANLVGRGAVVNDDAVGLAFAGYLIRLRVDQRRLLPDFLQLVLSSPVMRARIERQARSTSGVHNINSGEIKAIAFELPPLDVQAEIIELVDEQMSKIRDLDSWCQTELTRSAALRQSILKDAFGGRLVPQDPADEPAAALLARIREARAGRTTKSRRRVFA